MTLVNVTDFRRDLKKYAEMVKTEDIIVVSNGRQIMKITDPAKNKVLRMKRLRGIAKTDQEPVEIMKGKLQQL